MYKYIIERAGEMDLFAIGPLVLFFTVFMAFTIWILTKKRCYIDKMSNLPLED
ncbi:MAG: hypothetical protein R2769_05810 [Saprospiraceae bacterium]